ncbi:hypothetical protein KBB68_01655 [Candidatus Babeliales bacterium]|nr:hypothetical protein [Candidatus Babeliales bacterium]
MKFLRLLSDFFRSIFVAYFFYFSNLVALGTWNFNDNFRLKLHGVSVDEFYSGTNINVLNSAVGEDEVFYVLSTTDFYFHADYGDLRNLNAQDSANSSFLHKDYQSAHISRLSFYTDLRFRYSWGSAAESAIFNKTLTLVDIPQTIKGTRLNRHLLWMREGWIKIELGSDPVHKSNYIQIGLIPYQLGRGLSLGAAYDAPGFLGFNAGFAIDEYAPGILFSLNPVPSTVINSYVALIDNQQNSLNEIYEKIRGSDISAGCKMRGVNGKFFIVALDGKVTIEDASIKKKIIVEPYVMHLYAPDRNLEFTHDISSDLSTAGLAVEAEYGKVSWGFECARNFGEAHIKPWDRNQITFVRNAQGEIAEQYTKIYDKNPLDPTATLVDATTTNAYYVNASPKTSLENGKEIGPNLYNGLTRFRPEEKFNLTGYFFVGDVAYEYVKDFLTGGLGVGYFSGYPHQRTDLNHANLDAILHQDYTGFAPVQSQYSGTRIRNLIMFNQGIARYTVAAPEVSSPVENSTQPLVTDTLDSTTNIAFVGTRLAWHVQAWKDHKLLIAPNIIGYWSPEVPKILNLNSIKDSSKFLEIGDYLGTEINVELSMDIIHNLKLSGYAGMLLPGSYYHSLKGTYLREHKAKIGDSSVFICDIALSYVF